jgi:rubrerythrin
MDPARDSARSLPVDTLDAAAIWQDVLAQAMTGELIAALNYASLSEICDDPAAAEDALQHARGERGHAAAFAAEGRKLGVTVASNVDAKHWRRLREAFLRCVAARDVTGCLIVQEIMLESLAVASYERVARAAEGSLRETFAAIADEEHEHLAHAMEILRAERARDERSFDDKLHRLHREVMTILAEMLARDCRTGHCEVCQDRCVKPSLPDLRFSASELRGASLQQYLRTLDMLGLPGEVTLAWVAQLPV